MKTLTVHSTSSKLMKELGKFDKNCDFVLFVDEKPEWEISYMDGKTWARPYNEPRNVPYVAINYKGLMSIAEIKEYYNQQYNVLPALYTDSDNNEY